tara:strand:+ start:1096 stop:1212 length:117 start_codon:yes stop_codon:yes gene_type:complete
MIADGGNSTMQSDSYLGMLPPERLRNRLESDPLIGILK